MRWIKIRKHPIPENQFRFEQNRLFYCASVTPFPWMSFPGVRVACARFANVWSSRFHSGSDRLVTRGFSWESGVWINSRNGWAPTGISIFEAKSIELKKQETRKSFLYLKIKENSASLLLLFQFMFLQEKGCRRGVSFHRWCNFLRDGICAP